MNTHKSSQNKYSQSINIQKDQFLRRKQIQVSQSEFLSSHYAAKSLNLKQSYNPKDMFGKRMSSYWCQNDTIFSVIYKKMKRNFIKSINPDTYSKQSLISYKQQLIKDKFNVIGLIILVLTPTLIAHPIIKPRLNAIRRQMIFQYYIQAGVISRQLKTPLKKISKQEMEKIINQANQKINF